MTFSECCTSLGGVSEEGQYNNLVCVDAMLLGRPYDVATPCEYWTEGEEARSSFPFGPLLYDVGYFLGSLSAFLIPSTSKYKSVNPQNPPLVENYAKTAKETAEYGLAIFAVVLAVGVYLIKKYM